MNAESLFRYDQMTSFLRHFLAITRLTKNEHNQKLNYYERFIQCYYLALARNLQKKGEENRIAYSIHTHSKIEHYYRLLQTSFPL